MEPQTQAQPNKFLVPGAIVVAGALIAFAVYSGGAKAPVANSGTTAAMEVPAVTSKDHIRGNPGAKVVIVEYSDTECPFCKSFHNTLKDLTASYGDQVAWVYRHFPIAQLHSKAPNEAAATECVALLGGNNAFWSYLDSIFATTGSNDSLDPAQLPRLASAVGVDTTAFNACLSSGQFTKKIEDSVAEAVKIGARGTPYTVLVANDGTKMVVNGAEPVASVKAKIDTLLK
jgi:protein-disulfide isomerase